MKDRVEHILSRGIIQKNFSPYSSAICVISKKLDASGKKKWVVVIDYRKLNEQTIDGKNNLPLISSLTDKIGIANYFTTLDLANGFYQIQVDPADILKTAFSTEQSHFKFNCMPFGLKSY